jgi:hypothetical protein
MSDAVNYAQMAKDVIEKVFDNIVMGMPSAASEFGIPYVTHKWSIHVDMFEIEIENLAVDMRDRRAKTLVWRMLPEAVLDNDRVILRYRFHTMPD